MYATTASEESTDMHSIMHFQFQRAITHDKVMRKMKEIIILFLENAMIENQ